MDLDRPYLYYVGPNSQGLMLQEGVNLAPNSQGLMQPTSINENPKDLQPVLAIVVVTVTVNTIIISKLKIQT